MAKKSMSEKDYTLLFNRATADHDSGKISTALYSVVLNILHAWMVSATAYSYSDETYVRLLAEAQLALDGANTPKNMEGGIPKARKLGPADIRRESGALLDKANLAVTKSWHKCLDAAAEFRHGLTMLLSEASGVHPSRAPVAVWNLARTRATQITDKWYLEHLRSCRDCRDADPVERLLSIANEK